MSDDVDENGYYCVSSLGYAPSATNPETNIVTECSDIDECNAETQLTTVIQMQRVTTTQVVTHAAVTKDSDKLVMAMLVTVAIDECDALSPAHNCDQNVSCGDTIGSFECQCYISYRGNGVTCDDFDECAEVSNDCDVYATFTNTLDGFIGAFKPGWNTGGNGHEGVHAIMSTNAQKC